MSKLDGKSAFGDYTLTFNVNTFCDLEDHFDAADVNEVLAKIQSLEQSPSLKVMRGIFFVALRQEHPDITEAEAGAAISEQGIDEAAAALMEAVAAAFPDKGDEGNAKAKRGAGKKS